MLFSNYLEILFGRKVKVKILRALFRFDTKTFTSREIAVHIGVSHTAVIKSLGDLQDMNMIEMESHGKSNLITLNKSSCLYSHLKRFFGCELGTLEQLKEALREILPEAKSIAIFGSVAAKKESPNSDIDILVISNEKSKVSDIISKKQEQFTRKFGNALSAYVMSEGEFKKKTNTNFVKGILESHILVKGEKL